MSPPDLLFYHATASALQRSPSAALSRAPVLTVGETDNFAQQGGIIGFSLQESKVRFVSSLPRSRRMSPPKKIIIHCALPLGRRDEIGTLIFSFNDMLDEIQQRDAALQHAKDDLEDRV